MPKDWSGSGSVGMPSGCLRGQQRHELACCARRKVIMQNGKFYKRFPGDAEQVRRIVRFLIGQPEGGVRTLSGNLLTPRGLQSLGCQGRRSTDSADASTDSALPRCA